MKIFERDKLTRRDVLVRGLSFPVFLRVLHSSSVRASIVDSLPFLDDKPNPNTITEDGDKIIPFDLARLTSWVTPVDEFYVRNHFPAPKISSARDWVIHVSGSVRRAQKISLDQLKDFPHIEQVVTLECAGNSSHRNHGLVSNAKWRGVPLRMLLEKVGLQSNAAHVVFYGADMGGHDTHHFSRALSVDQAMYSENMLATEMNGNPLPQDHGFPVRLIVPGWYGMAHVKWLERIEVIDRPFDGRYQTTFYVNKRAMLSGENMAWKPEPITKIPVKSIVTRVHRDYLVAGNIYRVSGVVWGGDTPIESVEINIDDDAHWNPAILQHHRNPFAWTLWSYHWMNPSVAVHTLVSRATDHSGRRQPTKRSSRLRGPYQYDEVVRRQVSLS